MNLTIKALSVMREDGMVVEYSGTFGQAEVEVLVKTALIYLLRTGLLPFERPIEQIQTMPVDNNGEPVIQ